MVDVHDPEDDDFIQQQQSVDASSETEEVEGHFDGSVNDNAINLIPAKPMVNPLLLRRWFPNLYQSMHHQEDEIGNGNSSEGKILPNYKMYRTQHSNRSNNGGGNTSSCTGIMQIISQVCVLLRMRSTWRVLVFGFASFTIAINWTASEMIMPVGFACDDLLFVMHMIFTYKCLFYFIGLS